MENDKLHHLLKELQEVLIEIENKEPIPVEEFGALKIQVEQSLRELEDKDSEMLDHESLSHRLNSAVEVFEETHPKLTATLSDILRSLSRYGI